MVNTARDVGERSAWRPHKLLLSLDTGPAGALWRTIVGFAATRVIRWVDPGAGLVLAVFVLICVLFGIKVASAVGRKILPASNAVQREWERRRKLARLHDSYQWRKLSWIGLGFLAGSVYSPGSSWQLTLGVFCVGSGLVAEWIWRQGGAGRAESVPAERRGE